MSQSALVLAVVLVTPGLVGAEEHVHATASPTDPPIKITINPEARVSVTLGGAFPPPVACGKAAVLSVKIVNQGFVTSRLEAELVGDVPAGVVLDFHPAPLKGIQEERRELRVTLTTPGPVDLTVAFKAHNEIPDLGGRDHIHFMMRCI